jgi:hypothetical protein
MEEVKEGKGIYSNKERMKREEGKKERGKRYERKDGSRKWGWEMKKRRREG